MVILNIPKNEGDVNDFQKRFNNLLIFNNFLDIFLGKMTPPLNKPLRKVIGLYKFEFLIELCTGEFSREKSPVNDTYIKGIVIITNYQKIIVLFSNNLSFCKVLSLFIIIIFIKEKSICQHCNLWLDFHCF